MGAKTSTPNVGAAQPNNSRTFSASTSNFPGSEINGSLTGQQLLLRAIQYNQQNQQQNIAARRSVPNLHDHHGNNIAEGEMAAETGNVASGSNPLFRYTTGTTTTTSLPASMLWSLNGIKCPVCSKFVLPDDIECHLVMCLTKPRLSYNEDVLNDAKGECVICLEELLEGDIIARLPCLCIYHKGCIDQWFEVNRCCPEHPGD